MKQIVFESGPLALQYPDGIWLEAATAAEAISGLNGRPGFREEDGDRHAFALQQFPSRDSLYQPTAVERIVVTPVAFGAGGRGVFQIILGIILIIVGVLFDRSGTLVRVGVALLVSGLVQALMPQPEVRRQTETDARSAYLPANKNTTKIGTRIPLLFGRRRVWGHILTFNVSATNLYQPSLFEGSYDDGYSGGADPNVGWSSGSVSGSDYTYEDTIIDEENS
jgi:predicted phage tail protein